VDNNISKILRGDFRHGAFSIFLRLGKRDREGHEFHSCRKILPWVEQRFSAALEAISRDGFSR
jgi:hypothetical protein